MSTVTVGYLVGIVRKSILDEADYDFSDSQMVDLFNLCTRKIIALKPDAYIHSEVKLLDSGFEQTISTSQPIWNNVARPVCNMGTDGITVGAPVTEVLLETMDKYNPDWRTETASTTVQHLMRIPGVEDRYYIYPQSDGTNYLKIEGFATPTDVVWDADGDWEDLVISFDDTFVDVYRLGLMWLSRAEDTDIPGNIPQNDLYYKRFVEALGMVR